MPDLMRVLRIGFGLVVVSWGVLFVLARRLPRGAVKDLATVLPACASVLFEAWPAEPRLLERLVGREKA